MKKCLPNNLLTVLKKNDKSFTSPNNYHAHLVRRGTEFNASPDPELSGTIDNLAGNWVQFLNALCYSFSLLRPMSWVQLGKEREGIGQS